MWREVGPTELAVGVEGGGAYCAYSRCGGRWGLLSLQWVWREVGPTELAVGVEGGGAYCACTRCGGR